MLLFFLPPASSNERGLLLQAEAVSDVPNVKLADVEDGLQCPRVPGISPEEGAVRIRRKLVKSIAAGHNLEKNSLEFLEDGVPEERIHLSQQHEVLRPVLLGKKLADELLLHIDSVVSKHVHVWHLTRQEHEVSLTFGLHPSRPANPVDVVFSLAWWIVLDDVSDRREIQASRSNIRANENR